MLAVFLLIALSAIILWLLESFRLRVVWLVVEDERSCNYVIAADTAAVATHEGCDFLKGLHVVLCDARIAHSGFQRRQAAIERWRNFHIMHHLQSS
jgi:hypothetical protein